MMDMTAIYSQYDLFGGLGEWLKCFLVWLHPKIEVIVPGEDLFVPYMVGGRICNPL